MKKLIALSLALVMLVCFAACGASKLEPYEGDISALIASIYEKQGVEFMVAETTAVDLSDADAIYYYLGIGGNTEDEAVADEAAVAEDAAVADAAVAEDGAVADAAVADVAVADVAAEPAANETAEEADTAPAAMPEETTLAAAVDSGIKEAYFSEAMTGAQAYSLVLARVENATEEKVEEIKKAMFEGINPRKWCCVGADMIRVVSYKDVVMLVMVDSQLGDKIADGMVKAFAESVSGAEVTDVATVLTGEILSKG